MYFVLQCNMTILEQSFYGFKWIYYKNNTKTQLDHLFCNSNLIEYDLKRDLQTFWPKEGDIPDINKGIEIITNALVNNEKIGIVGDYDVDGSSATGLLIAYFTRINLNFVYHIPNRFTEGYGVSPPVLQKLIDQNIDIIITVDNGTTAYEAIDFAKKHNKKMIILDHHHLQDEISVDAFINPHRNNKGFEILCATGIVFIFLVELNRHLFQNKIITQKITMFDYIDVAAVATICDVMPMININRAIVYEGIKKINLNPRPVYKLILQDYLGFIDVQTIGFQLGPCINAPGRLGSANRAVEAVFTEDLTESKTIAADLINMNLERREIQKSVLEESLKQIENGDFINKKSIVVFGHWFEGVIGIIAGRLKDKYNKPVCVLTENQGLWKGSLRSVKGFHVGNMVHDAIKANIAEIGGGHDMAGGISLKKENLTSFIDFFETEVNKNNIPIKTELIIDTIVSISAIGKLMDALELFMPFGPNNESPLLMFPGCIIKQKRHIKNSILLIFQNASMDYDLSCWIFNAELKIIDTLKQGQKIDIVGYINNNKGKYSFSIIDFNIII